MTIEIADNGCGIPEEVLPQIFDPFFTTKGVGDGTGLGLSITHGMVQDHGGRLEVDSTPVVGPAFASSCQSRGGETVWLSSLNTEAASHRARSRITSRFCHTSGLAPTECSGEFVARVLGFRHPIV